MERAFFGRQPLKCKPHLRDFIKCGKIEMRHDDGFWPHHDERTLEDQPVDRLARRRGADVQHFGYRANWQLVPWLVSAPREQLLNGRIGEITKASQLRVRRPQFRFGCSPFQF